MTIKLLVTDNDGCLVGGEKDTPEYRAQKFREIRDFLSQYGIGFSMATGRSLTKSRDIIHELGMNAPCAVEMGTVIYDPRTGEKHILAYTDRFSHLRHAQDEVRVFRDNVYGNIESLQSSFGHHIRPLQDREYMVCVESCNSSSGFSLEPHLRAMMHASLRDYVTRGLVKIVPSKGAVDIQPALDKGDAIAHIMRLYDVSHDMVLSVGDASHTDISMMKRTKYAACPANSDSETLSYVGDRGNGYVSRDGFTLGFFDILNHAAREWGLNNR